MTIRLLRTNKHFLNRGVVGYFAPVIAACRIFRKRQNKPWNYLHQMRVIYRYAFGR